MVVELDTSVSNEFTLAMIKPDAVAAGKARDIMHAIESNGFYIIAKKYIQLTEAEAKEFYGEHEGKPFFPNLITFMTSGPIYALCMSKIGAISAWRALMGPTNSKEAREIKPTSLRALYGTDNTKNACHGSDSTNSARREVLFYFPDISFPQLVDQGDLRKYIKKELEPILKKGLTVLCKHKPSAGKLEATKFLAHWLLENNPNKGRIIMDGEDFDIGEEEEEEDFELIFEGKKEIGGGAAAAGKQQQEKASSTAAAKEEGVDKYEEKLVENVDSLEMEHAALKVQSNYRAFVARKTVNEKKQAKQVIVIQNQDVAEDEEQAEITVAATKIQSSFRAKKARNQVKEMKEESDAATRVQASFRAKQARTRVKELKEETEAATKVQAGFRSMKARQRVKEMKEEKKAGDEASA
ncbi:nucleoside diphosphate kinase [Chloropicon primus]|uniref:Nucleoside diphosphate kinase n=2 Tax=Chloropicon primus TaxID=1764295 RepID=A0A5B8ML47_9CHLO|nr:nucleoside diphosphate kinase [Chloropicon primus]UPR00410.1 nucleoside diphosphate kinase [Chloropicon primus]|eukprot:QDZ21196.1 nucleoside diphosphate kinase [Chloropicon primus]